MNACLYNYGWGAAAYRCSCSAELEGNTYTNRVVLKDLAVSNLVGPDRIFHLASPWEDLYRSIVRMNYLRFLALSKHSNLGRWVPKGWDAVTFRTCSLYIVQCQHFCNPFLSTLYLTWMRKTGYTNELRIFLGTETRLLMNEHVNHG